MNDLEYTLGLDVDPYLQGQKKATAANRALQVEQQAFATSLDRLTSVQNRRALEAASGYNQEIILKREIIALETKLATLEGNSAERVKTLTALEERRLLLERQQFSNRESNLAALAASEQRLSALEKVRAMESAAGYSKEIILQREIIALQAQLAKFEGDAAEKVKLQVALAERQLQLERAIATTRTGGGSPAAGLREAAGAAREAEVATGAFGQQLRKIINVGQAVKSVLAGIGLGMFAPNAADKIARTITGVSKEEEAALERLGALSDQVAEKQIAAARERLTTEQDYQLMLQERERLELRISENSGRTTADQVKLAEDKLRLLDLEKESATTLERIERDRYEAAKEDADRRERQDKLIADAKKEWDRQEAQMRAEKAREENEAQEKALRYVEENRERLLLEAKATRGLTEEEHTRLSVLRLQLRERQSLAEIDALLVKQLQSSLNPEEKARLATLIRQGAAITEQIRALERTKEVVADVGAAIDSNIAKWRDFTLSIRSTGRSDKDLSDAELAKKAANLRADIAAREAGQFMGPQVYTGASNTDPLLGPQRFNLAALETELRLRDEVRRNASFYGEDRAFQMFGGSMQRFEDILRGITEQQAAQRKDSDNLNRLADWVRQGAPTTVLNPRG